VARRVASIALVGGVFVSKAATASAQMIRGRLLDVHSDAPIASGLVAVLDSESAFIVQARTDSAGAFTLLLPRAGQGVLFASRDGYYDMIGDTVDLLIGDTIDLEFRLQPMVVALDTLTAVVRSGPPVNPRLVDSGFYDRRKQGFGNFFSHEFFDRYPPGARMTDVLRRVPGLQVTDDGGVSLRTGAALAGGCSAPRVFVDGVEWALSSRPGINEFRPDQIEALEVYTHLGALPPQFGGATGACGAIVLWLRR
jgi:Carboxypeptidase regulatory-like domain/TonB-dependent Receptor Plug Domain